MRLQPMQRRLQLAGNSRIGCVKFGIAQGFDTRDAQGFRRGDVASIDCETEKTAGTEHIGDLPAAVVKQLREDDTTVEHAKERAVAATFKKQCEVFTDHTAAGGKTRRSAQGRKGRGRGGRDCGLGFGHGICPHCGYKEARRLAAIRHRRRALTAVNAVSKPDDGLGRSARTGVRRMDLCWRLYGGHRSRGRKATLQALADGVIRRR
ncbi:hypothetical protein D9M70_515450 [compost metagenome]